MEYKTLKEKKYLYQCRNCGNEFEKDYEVIPYKCYDCNELYPFEYEILEIEVIYQYCPICKQFFKTSNYLNQTFNENEHVRWLANMVTHYRHDHISYYDKCYGHNSHYYRKGWGNYMDLNEERKKVNERAKRQILRKAKDYMKNNGFKTEHVLQLQHTEDKTIELYTKILDKN